MSQYHHIHALDTVFAPFCLLQNGVGLDSIDQIVQDHLYATTTFHDQVPVGFSYVTRLSTGQLLFGGSATPQSITLPNRYKQALYNCQLTLKHVSRETVYAVVDREKINVLLTLGYLGFRILKQTSKDSQLTLMREPNHE